MKETNEKQELNKLIEESKNGNIQSLEKLLKKTEKKSWGVLYYLTKDETEAGEILQDVLLKVAKNIKNLKTSESYKPWLNKIIMRQYYDYLRKKNKTKANEEFCTIKDNEKFDEKIKEPIDDVIGTELAKIIKESICKLSEPYKIAIIMREFEGLSYGEIAKATKTSVGTVKSRIARARTRLKEYIKPYIN